MGQKTHPIGIRLGITRQPCSSWYAKNIDYPFFLKEDKYLRDYVFQTRNQCIISKIQLKRRRIGVCICISAAQIRPLIGTEGTHLKRLHNRLVQKCQTFRQDYQKHFRFLSTDIKKNEKPEIQIFVQQLEYPETCARCLTHFIVTELEKRNPFRRVLRTVQERCSNLNQILGLRLQISGRLNGAEIARTEWIRNGRVPLHTFSVCLDYACNTAHTIYGLLGIKVWIFCTKIEKSTIILGIF